MNVYLFLETTSTHNITDLPTVPLLAGQSRIFTRCLASRKIMDFFLEMSRFFLPRCPDVNANHPIERNYGNSVRFHAKTPNGSAAESPCYSVFWNAIDFCRLYTSKKNLNVGPSNRPAFCRQVPLFYAKCPSKTLSRLAGLTSTQHNTSMKIASNEIHSYTRIQLIVFVMYKYTYMYSKL